MLSVRESFSLSSPFRDKTLYYQRFVKSAGAKNKIRRIYLICKDSFDYFQFNLYYTMLNKTLAFGLFCRIAILRINLHWNRNHVKFRIFCRDKYQRRGLEISIRDKIREIDIRDSSLVLVRKRCAVDFQLIEIETRIST